MNLLELNRVPILEQLQLEEALLRTEEESFCIINRGSPRAIVMGLSGVPEDLLHLGQVQQHRIPVIKRYSGGGTVIIDENTLFVSFLFSKKDLPIEAFPEPILRWSADLYQKAWQLPGFVLHENDFALGLFKCGGNALYIRKDRWLLHTSFLWDYRAENMNMLLLPKTRPTYRQNRSHADFLCRLKEVALSLDDLIKRLKGELVKRLDMRMSSLSEYSAIRQKPHRQSTHLLTLIK